MAKRYLNAAILGALLALATSLGCSFLKASVPEQRARVAKFECQVDAVRPLVDGVFDAEELVRDLNAGKASISALLSNLDAKPAEVAKLLADLGKCEPDAGAELPEGVSQ
jgi:hypothetical protein